MASFKFIRLFVACTVIVSCLAVVLSAHAEDPAAHSGAAGGHAAHSGGSEPNPMATDPDLAIFTAIVFIVLLVVLRAIAWKPIVEALQKRENAIAGEIAAANAKHEEAKRLLSAHELKLASAADQIRELLEEARRDAEHTKQEIVAEAKTAANAERQRAVREVELARDTALKQLAESSANMAISLASSAVRQNLTADQQSRIVRESLGMIGNGNQN